MNNYPRINAPLIVFGRDASITYPLLMAIAQRRVREQRRQRRIMRFKHVIFSPCKSAKKLLAKFVKRK